MSDWFSRLFTAVIVLCLAGSAGAQNRAPLAVPASIQNTPATLTGKERLGRKWMDEQRIDNCNVPPDKRGSRPRPSGCPHTPTG
jgi:hypothetical protein